MDAAGGIESTTLQVCRELARRGHELVLLYTRDGDLGDEWRQIARTVQVGDFGWSKRHPIAHSRRLWPTVSAAAGVRPDVVWLTRPEHIVWGIAASHAARAPLVVHLHHVPDYPGLRILGRRVGKFIAVSDFIARRWVDAGLRREWVEVVYNGVDPADYPLGGPPDMSRARAALNLPPDAFVVLVCGRVGPDKGTDVILEAWRRLRLGPDRARLLITSQPVEGDAQTPYIRGLHRDQPYGCEWLPMIADVVPMLHAADVVVLPSRVEEAFGRVIIEAMATGRPALASRVGGVPEILTGEWSKMLVEPGDPHALAGALAQLLDWRLRDPDLRGRAARHVADHFSLAGSAGQIERALRAAARPALPGNPGSTSF
jgi:glycosyltransferase involved in cell wall biosynthesis